MGGSTAAGSAVTSVTEKICGDLAVELWGDPAGDDMLGQVVDRDLFVQRVEDGDREWYRYQPLFGDFLRRRLRRYDAGRADRLHAVASTWFADHGMLTEAVDHALAAGAPQQAVNLVEERAVQLIEGSRMATLLGLVAKLPGNLVISNIRLQLCVAWANIGLQRPLPARTALGHVDRLLDAATADSDTSDSDTVALRVEAEMIRLADKFVTDSFDGVPSLVADHIDDAVNPFFVTIMSICTSIDAYYRFDFDEARHRQQQATPYHERSGGPFGVMYGHAIAGLSAYEQLDIVAAESSFRTALEVARRSGSRSHAARLASALLGGLLYHEGELAEAEVLLDESFELGSEGGPPEFLMATYGTAAAGREFRFCR